jgi:hypothetical protein
MQSTSSIHISSIRYSHLPLGLSNGLFPSGFPTRIVYAVLTYVRLTSPTHLIRSDLITPVRFCEKHKL